MASLFQRRRNKATQTERVRERKHEGFLRYAGFRWAKISGGLCLLIIISYALVDVTPRHNGGSWYGYTLGTIGAGLILWLTALGYRKRKMTSDYWSLKAWTSRFAAACSRTARCGRGASAPRSASASPARPIWKNMACHSSRPICCSTSA